MHIADGGNVYIEIICGIVGVEILVWFAIFGFVWVFGSNGSKLGTEWVWVFCFRTCFKQFLVFECGLILGASKAVIQV